MKTGQGTIWSAEATSMGKRTYLMSPDATEDADLSSSPANNIALLHDDFSLLEVRSWQTDILASGRSRGEDADRNLLTVRARCKDPWILSDDESQLLRGAEEKISTHRQ